MAEGHDVGAACLRAYPTLSFGRAFRLGWPDAPGCGFGAVEYRRGQARQGTREFLVFLSHASGSLAEIETQLLLAERLRFAAGADLAPAVGLVHELQKMIAAMQDSLRKRL
ncbi:MAG TPA: four helix bundle protein [Candidatus Acidoferrales bacterium]|nr:four helix bundle protein [Candidatus Acidoferrales bacterium]